jgi:hypothetical protein
LPVDLLPISERRYRQISSLAAKSGVSAPVCGVGYRSISHWFRNKSSGAFTRASRTAGILELRSSRPRFTPAWRKGDRCRIDAGPQRGKAAIGPRQWGTQPGQIQRTATGRASVPPMSMTQSTVEMCRRKCRQQTRPEQLRRRFNREIRVAPGRGAAPTNRNAASLAALSLSSSRANWPSHPKAAIMARDPRFVSLRVLCATVQRGASPVTWPR